MKHISSNYTPCNEVVVIPVLDPSWQLVSLISNLQHVGFHNIVVVDDGSTSPVSNPIFNMVQRNSCIVIHHPVNLGKGSAIKTALARIPQLFPHARACVTVDGDGQHLPKDVLAVCKFATNNPEAFVLGVRDFSSKDVPARSRFGNAFSALFFRADTGQECRDTQTGLRCIPLSLYHLAMHTPGSRYDYEMNFLTAVAKQGIAINQVPIETVYHDNNAASHFRVLHDSLLIYKQFLCFALASLACSLADLSIFALLAAVLPLQTATLIAVATVAARISSGVLNFTLNRIYSFKAKQGNSVVQAGRYGLLFVSQMLLSMLFVTVLSPSPLPLVVTKMFVDTALFFISYFVQRNWVFDTKKSNECSEPEKEVSYANGLSKHVG